MDKVELRNGVQMTKGENMNNWIFRIEFSGLAAFVMRPSGSGVGARVILMNALNYAQKHVPELRYDERDAKKSSPWKIPFPGKDIKDDPKDDKKKKWMLKHLDLNFLPAPGAAIQPPFKSGGSIEDHLLKLGNIMPSASEINPACFDPEPREELVVVRVPLRHGKLKKTKLAFETYNQIVHCQFAPKNSTENTISHSQKCAIEVALEFKVEEGPLTLVGIPFNGGSSFGIAFEPANGNKVVVELENRPEEQEKSRRIGKGKDMDDDFALHYEISCNKPDDEDRVVPIYDALLRAESGNCILARFDDDCRA
jgi:hypothetical protein